MAAKKAKQLPDVVTVDTPEGTYVTYTQGNVDAAVRLAAELASLPINDEDPQASSPWPPPVEYNIRPLSFVEFMKPLTMPGQSGDTRGFLRSLDDAQGNSVISMVLDMDAKPPVVRVYVKDRHRIRMREVNLANVLAWDELSE